MFFKFPILMAINGEENNVVENSNGQQSTIGAISTRSHTQSNQPMEYNQNQLKWLEDDYICRGMILNAMSDPIFDIFRHHLIALELWNAVQSRYVTNDAGNHSFLTNKYIEFRMVDSKSIV
ncbi:LOW QUALITY PROTEIN: hypothetical protein TorRG33x02_007740 [Trema orientale]|uniref:Uncharacterized protein n=1 Tax=Trema orientale TaxID=63057 RepID=A0A2P5G0M6_TREOI|nr:LOW QUALITY PROTEIN: hypothetical protein TorRG33x02_007740 [Trema orientale]